MSTEVRQNLRKPQNIPQKPRASPNYNQNRAANPQLKPETCKTETSASMKEADVRYLLFVRHAATMDEMTTLHRMWPTLHGMCPTSLTMQSRTIYSHAPQTVWAIGGFETVPINIPLSQPSPGPPIRPALKCRFRMPLCSDPSVR